MMNAEDLEVILTCTETEAAFLAAAAQHGIDTRMQRAALFALQARVIAELAELRKPPAPKAELRNVE